MGGGGLVLERLKVELSRDADEILSAQRQSLPCLTGP